MSPDTRSDRAKLIERRNFHLDRANAINVALHEIGHHQDVSATSTRTRNVGTLAPVDVEIGARPRPRRFSAAARRRMSAGMRKFWARRRAEGKVKAKA